MLAMETVTPAPNKHPDIFPIEVVKGLRASSIPLSRSQDATFPSIRPAQASVIASPASAHITAPKIPANVAPARVAIVMKPVSKAPKAISAPTDAKDSLFTFRTARGVSPRIKSIGPAKLVRFLEAIG